MKKFSIFALALLLFLPSFCFLGCKKKENLTDISANLSNYALDIVLDAENKQVVAKEKLDYINSSQDIIKNVCFHLYPRFFEEGAEEYIVPPTKMNTAYPNGKSYSKFNVSRVLVSGQDVAIKYEGECDAILNVPLFDSLLPQQRVEIEIQFAFSLPNCRHRFGYGENTINLANFYPIVCVWQNGEFDKSSYNANGDPFFSDVANYEVSILVAENYVVASTGNLVEKLNSNGQTTHRYSAKVVRDFAIVASNKFKVENCKAGDVEVSYFYFADKNPQKSLQCGADAINTFSNLFGEYPYNRFTIVEADFIQGGMEYPNLVMISTDVEQEVDYLNVIVHETAHQWWYGVVGNNEFEYPWLDEALTDFSCALFYDENTNYELTHQKMVEIDRKNYSLFITVYEDVLGKIDTSMRAVNLYNTEPEYTYCIYVKGVLMYESLHTLIGHKNFVKALKNYYQQYAYKNAQPQNLIVCFEQASGQSLTNFFDSWVKGKVVIK